MEFMIQASVAGIFRPYGKDQKRDDAIYFRLHGPAMGSTFFDLWTCKLRGPFLESITGANNCRGFRTATGSTYP